MKRITFLFALMMVVQIIRSQDFDYHFVTDEYRTDIQAYGDFDGDGDIDIFGMDRADESPNHLVYYEYDDAFAMNVSYINSSIEATGLPAAGDFDGDGDIDVMVAVGYDNPELFIYTNDGNGVLTPVATGIKDVTKLHSVDFDSDGDMDIVAGEKSKISFFANDGNGTFALQYTFDTEIDYLQYFVDDFNGDAKFDILVRYEDENKNKLHIFKNVGSGHFTGYALYEQEKKIDRVRVKDFDTDGDMDIVIDDDDFLTCFVNAGNVTFTVKVVLEAEGFFDSYDDFDIVDIDNDGDMDVVIADERSGLYWYKNTGGSSLDEFEKIQIWDQKPNFHLGLQDFNGDGKLDIFTEAYFATGIIENALKLGTTASQRLNDIVLYPNPTTGKIHINAEDIQEISISDILGKVYQVKSPVANIIDVSQYESGVYLVKIKTEKGYFIKKILKR